MPTYARHRPGIRTLQLPSSPGTASYTAPLSGAVTAHLSEVLEPYSRTLGGLMYQQISQPTVDNIKLVLPRRRISIIFSLQTEDLRSNPVEECHLQKLVRS